jgi:hypothetical protein
VLEALATRLLASIDECGLPALGVGEPWPSIPGMAGKVNSLAIVRYGIMRAKRVGKSVLCAGSFVNASSKGIG